MRQVVLYRKGNIIFDVKSTKRETSCHKCGQLTKNKYGYGETLTIRHVSILDKAVYLRICVVRYQCMDCDDHPTTSEKYDWCERKLKTTKALDAYINHQLIHSTVEDVSKKGHVNYRIVESSLNRCFDKKVNWANFDDLTTIGIDEIALKKRQNDYVVIVSSKDKHGNLSVIGVLPDRLKETTKIFLESIPDDLKKTVKSVCTDMCDSFVNSAKEVFIKR